MFFSYLIGRNGIAPSWGRENAPLRLEENAIRRYASFQKGFLGRAITVGGFLGRKWLGTALRQYFPLDFERHVLYNDNGFCN